MVLETISDWIKPGWAKGPRGLIRSLIDHGADVERLDFHDFSILHYAAMWGWLPMVKMLVARDMDVNAVTITGRTPLMYAVELMHVAVVKFLANHHESELNIPDADGMTPLLLAMELALRVYLS